jgi:uncharacterized protein
MKNKWLIALGLVGVLLVAGLAGCSGNVGTPSAIQVNMNSQQEGIWVNGEGKVVAVPDVATISLGISAQANTVALAQSQASEAMNNVLKALTDNGVAKKDIQTRQFSINKVSRWDKDTQQEIVIGYQVTNTVVAKVRDIPKTGTVIDAVALAGGDLTRIDGISFSIDDPTAYQAEVREKAIAAARAKAEQMAKLSGVTLGKPTYISESSYIPGPVYRADMAKESSVPTAAPTPIEVGEQEIRVNVQITYAIK